MAYELKKTGDEKDKVVADTLFGYDFFFLSRFSARFLKSQAFKRSNFELIIIGC